MTRFTFDTTIERGDDELELVVTYSVTPFIEQTYWQPAEGGEVELHSVKHGDVEIELTDAEESAIIDECQARCCEDQSEAEADRGDYLYEQQRDRIMMDRWNEETR